MSTLIAIFRKSRSSLPLVVTILLVSLSFISLDPLAVETSPSQRFPNSLKEFAAPGSGVDPSQDSHAHSHSHLHSNSDARLSHVGKAKVYALLGVDIELLSLPPENTQDVVRLRAKIEVHRSLGEKLSYQWKLPPEASVIGGDSKGVLEPIESGKIYEVEVTVTGMGPKDSVHFETYFEQQAQKFGSSGVLNFGYQEAEISQ